MIPQQGQHVKCLLRNNLMVEGVVESWSIKQSVLRSLDGASVSIITNSEQDIVVIKIIFKNSENVKTELEEKFEKVSQEPGDDDLRIKNLAELKSLMIEQEKKIIADKLRNHYITGVKGVKYGQPRFFKKQGSE